jgi:membrane peptidoglycan carboxypeptidase
MYYFGREPPELNQIESVYLIKLLPNPIKRHEKTYARNTVSKRRMDVYHRVLKTMNERKRITDFELVEGLNQELEFHIGDAPLPIPRPPVRRYDMDDNAAGETYDSLDDTDSEESFW